MTEEISEVLYLSELKNKDFNKLKKWKKEEYRKIRSDLGLILEGQKINQKVRRLSFIELATQNSEFLERMRKKGGSKRSLCESKTLTERSTNHTKNLSVTDSNSRKSELYFGKVNNCFLSADGNWSYSQPEYLCSLWNYTC